MLTSMLKDVACCHAFGKEVPAVLVILLGGHILVPVSAPVQNTNMWLVLVMLLHL